MGAAAVLKLGVECSRPLGCLAQPDGAWDQLLINRGYKYSRPGRSGPPSVHPPLRPALFKAAMRLRNNWAVCKRDGNVATPPWPAFNPAGMDSALRRGRLVLPPPSHRLCTNATRCPFTTIKTQGGTQRQSLNAWRQHLPVSAITAAPCSERAAPRFGAELSLLACTTRRGGVSTCMHYAEYVRSSFNPKQWRRVMARVGWLGGGCVLCARWGGWGGCV